MQGVGMEEHGIAWRQLTRYHLEPRHDVAHARGIGDVLALARHRDVVDAAEVMRALHHLQAAIRRSGGIERDLAARQMRKDAAVVVPVAVVLVPFPSSSDKWLLRG